MRLRFATSSTWKRLVLLSLILAALLCWMYFAMIHMPGKSFTGALPPLTDRQATLAAQLHWDVDMLAGIIGKRNVEYPKGYSAAAAFLEKSLTDAGYRPQRHIFDTNGLACVNIEAEIAGAKQPDQIVIIGAHYDSVDDSPAANDNGSGVAATLALARAFANTTPDRTLRFVLFANEEPPHFQTDSMGSLVYARRCKERGENIVAMISLETIGYYSDAPGSQTYPMAPIGWLYPTTGNFIGFVGNYSSSKLVRQSIKSFRTHAEFPSEGGALPGWITGVGWSDHWSFWRAGYPAIMVTDTAPFRYPYYHSNRDTPEKLDYERMARVVEGMEAVVRELTQR